MPLTGSAIIAVIAIFAILIILGSVIYIKLNKPQKTQNEKPNEEIITDIEPEFKAVGAVVLGKQATMHVNKKNHYLEFKVSFFYKLLTSRMC